VPTRQPGETGTIDPAVAGRPATALSRRVASSLRAVPFVLPLPSHVRARLGSGAAGHEEAKMRVRRGSLFLLAAAATALTGACSGGGGAGSEATGRAAEAVTGTPFYYLRCNNTDWGVDEGSRLRPTADPQLLSLTVNARVLSDPCSVTEVIATGPDSWGTSQTFFTTSSGQSLAVPGSAALVGKTTEINFTVNYPSTGSFSATFNTTTNTVAIAAAGTIEGRLEQSPGSGVAGTIVTLKGPSGGVFATTSTDADGAYQFPGLAPSSYSVSFAATASGTQPAYTTSGSSTIAVLGNTTALDATCTPTSAPCTAGAAVNDPFHQLVIVDPNVTNPVNDPIASNASDGHFSFRYLLEQLSGCPNASTNASCMSSFVNGWINQLGTQQTVNGFSVPPRLTSLISQNWPKLTDGTTLDMSQAPFQLLAIVNRTDLHATGQGEGRLVYGFVGPQSGPNPGPQTFTVIAEFLLPATGTLTSRKAWVNAFFGLPNAEGFQQACASSPNPRCVYNHNLQTLTDPFVTAAQLFDLRTNDFFLAPPGTPPPWGWRQFAVQIASGQNHLVTVGTAETPDISLNGSASVGNFLSANAAQVRDGFVSLPASFTAGEAFDLVQNAWSFPSVDAATSKSFSGRTCNGCHVFIATDPAFPTGGGPFFHVNPTAVPDATGQNILSPFVTAIEIPRRASFMTNWLTCNFGSAPCGNGVEVALTQF
jgi:SdrD B-like domain